MVSRLVLVLKKPVSPVSFVRKELLPTLVLPSTTRLKGSFYLLVKVCILLSASMWNS